MIFRGLGHHRAKTVVSAFSVDFDYLRLATPEQLAEVSGIGAASGAASLRTIPPVKPLVAWEREIFGSDWAIGLPSPDLALGEGQLKKFCTGLLQFSEARVIFGFWCAGIV